MKRFLGILALYSVAFLMGWLCASRFSPTLKIIHLHVLASPAEIMKGRP